MKRLFTSAVAIASALSLPFLATAETKACRAPNGVQYNPEEIFDPAYSMCYPTHRGECPLEGSVCENHALVKLANYDSPDGQDLIYSPHRGLWGQLYGSLDPEYTVAPGQNTDDAFRLITSFATKYSRNAQGRDYGAFLRGQIVELDMTTNGDDVQTTPGILVDHYVTTANTIQGTLNDYLVTLDDQALGKDRSLLHRRDFSASTMTLSETPVGSVTQSAIVRQQGFGLIAFHDIKSRRGDIQCQVFKIDPNDANYSKYNCRFNEPALAAEQELRAQILSVRAMREAGGGIHIVMKTTATYDDMLNAFMRIGKQTREQADFEMRRYMWQPHPKGKGGVQSYVQYIHDWLVNVPRSVEAWETNIYFAEDETNRAFCVQSYDPDVKPYGKITTKYVSGGSDGCIHGPYVNLLDYIRQNTGNPDYFGFSEEQKQQRLISGNRANLWLLDTSAAVGTSDRMYRWQMLGSERTYNMSDIVRYLSYPYVSYQIINADRLDVVYQAIEKGMYPRDPGDVSARRAMRDVHIPAMSEEERAAGREKAERRADDAR